MVRLVILDTSMILYLPLLSFVFGLSPCHFCSSLLQQACQTR
ncbi:hypothetical protein GF377_05440 [candidate division GN15 bacterium]|nr:hypothetical protein [candidate division GN15 bacterium]